MKKTKSEKKADHPSRQAVEAGYETSDFSARQLWKFILYLLAVIVAVQLILICIYGGWNKSTVFERSRGPVWVGQPVPPVEVTNLENESGLESQKVDSADRRILNSYGWVDQKSGVARVPIERAMELYLKPGTAKGVAFEQNLNEQIPMNLKFVDENSQEVLLGRLFKSKPVILVMAYYGCRNLCTVVLNSLVEGLLNLKGLDLGKDFEVITVSIDPNEGPRLASEKKSTYLRRYGNRGVASGWHFLTGTEFSIKALTQKVGFKYELNPNTRQYIHPGGIVVITPSGRIARYFLGIDYSPADLRLALIESSSEKIGDISDRIALLCYEFDPTAGRYVPSIMRLLRVTGVLTIALVAWVLHSQYRQTG